MKTNPHLSNLFEPKSVAVIGASATPGKIGHIIVDNLIQGGYKGKIFPVNPKGGTILDLEAVKRIEDLPSSLDLAVICLPPALVLASMEELGALPAKAVIVITAGFKEVGREGHDLEEKLKEIAEKHSMALLGPNCLGMINTDNGCNASFAAGKPTQGNIAFFSQSGALCVAILDWALGENIGFSKFISLGNKALLSESDMLSYLIDDPQTNVILGYCESLEDGQDFVRMASKTTQKKPVIIIKAGNTAAGAKAASSHTGAIAGSTQAYKAAFTQSGVIQADNVESLFRLAQAFSSQPLPQGPNLIVVTNSGRPGHPHGRRLRELLAAHGPSPQTIEKLQRDTAPLRLALQPHRHHRRRDRQALRRHPGGGGGRSHGPRHPGPSDPHRLHRRRSKRRPRRSSTSPRSARNPSSPASWGKRS